jgi:sugar phosphate isomerase/epimerase
VRDPREVALPELRRLLRGAAVEVSAIATGQACLADGLCLLARDDAIRAAAVERFRGQAALAASLGAVVILGGVRGRVAAASAGDKVRRTEVALESIGACVQAAVQAGARVVLEPLNRYETDFVNTVEEGLALIDQIGSPALGLLLDSFHMNIEEPLLPAAIHRAGDRLGYVHLADSNRLAPGLGHIDFVPVLEALEEVGYAGPIVAEILPIPDDETAARHAAEFLRRAVAAGPAGSLAFEPPR